MFNVGGSLTHGDFALEAGADLAVVEHRLIPAMRSEWAGLRRSERETSHVGNAGVGVVSLKGAPLSLPTLATAQFQRFFDCGRAVRCLLPLSGSVLESCGVVGPARL